MIYEGKYSLTRQLLTESIELNDATLAQFRAFLAEPDRHEKGKLGEQLVELFHQGSAGGNVNFASAFEPFTYKNREGRQVRVNPSTNNPSFPLMDFASNQVSVENLRGKKPKYHPYEEDSRGRAIEDKPGVPKVAFYSIKASNTYTKSGAGKRGSQSSGTSTHQLPNFLNRGQEGSRMLGLRPYLDAAFPEGRGYIALGCYCISPKTEYNARTGEGRRETTGLIIEKKGPKLWRIEKDLPDLKNFHDWEFESADWVIVGPGNWIDIGKTGDYDVLTNNFGPGVIVGESGYEGRPEMFQDAGDHSMMRTQDRNKRLRHDLKPGFPLERSWPARGQDREREEGL